MSKRKNRIFLIFLSLFISFNLNNLSIIKAQTDLSNQEITLDEEETGLDTLESIDLDFDDSLGEDELDLYEEDVLVDGETISIPRLIQNLMQTMLQGKLAERGAEKIDTAKEEVTKIKLPLIGELQLRIISKNELKNILSAKGFDANIDASNSAAKNITTVDIDEDATNDIEEEADISDMLIFGQISKQVKVGPLEISEVIFILKQTGKIKLFFNAKLFNKPVVVKSKGIKISKESIINLVKNRAIPEIESIGLIAMPLKGQQITFNLLKKDIEVQIDSAALRLSIAESNNTDDEEAASPGGKTGELQLQANIRFPRTKDDKGNIVTGKLFMLTKGLKTGTMQTMLQLNDINIESTARVLGLNDLANILAKSPLNKIKFVTLKAKTTISSLLVPERDFSLKISGLVDLSEFKINLPGLDKVNLKQLSISGKISTGLLDFQSVIGNLTIPNLGEIKQAGFRFRLEKGSTPELALTGKGILKDLDYNLILQVGQDAGQANIELVDATIDKFLKILNLNDIANLIAATPLKDIKFPKLGINTSIQSLSQKSISGKISGIADLSNFKLNLPLANQVNLKELAVSGSIVKKGALERSLSLNIKLGELTLPILGKLNNGILDIKLEKNKKPEIDLKGQGIFNLFGQALPYQLQAEYKREETTNENVDPKSGFIFRGMLGSKALVDANEVPDDLDYMTDEQQQEAEELASSFEKNVEQDKPQIARDENKKHIFELKIGELNLGQPEFELNINKKTMVIKSYSNLLQKAIGLIVNFEFNIDLNNQTVSISAQPNMVKEEDTGELVTPTWQPFKDAANLQDIITALKAQTTDKGIQDFLTKLEDISIRDIKLEFEAGIAGGKATKTTTIKTKTTNNPQNLIGNVSIMGSADFFGLAAVSSIRLGKMQEALDAAISFELEKALTKEERAAQLSAGYGNTTSRKKGITLLDLLSIVPGLESKIPNEKITIEGKQYDNPIIALLTLVETTNTKINISTLPAPKISMSGAISIPINNDNPAFKVIDRLVKIVEKGGTIPPSLQMSGAFNLASLKRLIELKASLTSGDMIKLAPTLPANAPATLKNLFEFKLSNIALDFIARAVPSVGLGLSFNYKPPVLLGNITRDGKTNQALALASELNFTVDTFDVAGKIEGIWNKPFGLSELSFGNMGIKFSKRYDEFIAEIAAAASVAAGIAAFIPSDFGIAGELTIGDSKTRAFINIGTDIKSLTIDIEGKNLGANELIMSGVKVINGYVRDYGPTVQKVTGLAPKQLPTQLIKNSLDKFVGPALPIQLNDFNMKFSPLGAQIAGLETLPGFALGGRITVFGKEAQAIGNLNLQGVELSGYLPPLKIGALTIARSQSEASKKREKEVLDKINEFKRTFVEPPAEDSKNIEQELEQMSNEPTQPKAKAAPLTALPEGPNAAFKVTTSGDVKLVLNGLLQLGDIFKSETDIEISANRINLDTETKIGSGDCAMGLRIKSLGKDIEVKDFLTDPAKLGELGIETIFESNMIDCINRQIKNILNEIRKAIEKGEKANIPLVSELVGALGVVAQKGGEFITNTIEKSLKINSAYTQTTLKALADGVLPGLTIKYQLGGKDKTLDIKGFDLKDPLDSTKKIAEALIGSVKDNINILFDLAAIAKEVGKAIIKPIATLIKGIPDPLKDCLPLNPGESRYFEIKEGKGIQEIAVPEIYINGKWTPVDLNKTPGAVLQMPKGGYSMYWYIWGQDKTGSLKLTEITRDMYDALEKHAKNNKNQWERNSQNWDKSEIWKDKCPFPKNDNDWDGKSKYARWVCECALGKKVSCTDHMSGDKDFRTKHDTDKVASDQYPRRVSIFNATGDRTEFCILGEGITRKL